MRADFELFTALLVDVRRAVHGEALDARRQRNGTAHLRARALSRVDDFPGRIIENAVVEGFQPDTDVLTLHGLSLRVRCFLFQNFCDDAGADGSATFTDGEAQL